MSHVIIDRELSIPNERNATDFLQYSADFK